MVDGNIDSARTSAPSILIGSVCDFDPLDSLLGYVRL